MPTARNDPARNFNFTVDLGGASIQAAFSEVSGLGMEIIPIEYRTGAEDRTVRKLPGLQKFSNIVLRRGIVADRAIWEWLNATAEGDPTLADVTVSLLNHHREPAVTWGISSAWPCRWSGPTLDATSNAIALETLELCHEGIALVHP